MSRIDKKIAELGYSVYQTTNEDPPRIVEYRMKTDKTLFADNVEQDYETLYSVMIFAYDLEGHYALSGTYTSKNNAAVGGDLEYGNIIVGLTDKELKIFYRKIKSLKRRYKLRKIFRRTKA
jgi:hypothetical protein